MSQSASLDALCARLDRAMDAWSWHDEDENRREGYGHHMSQMLARLPKDSQTRDMELSIRQMLTDLDTALYLLGVHEEAGCAIPHEGGAA